MRSNFSGTAVGQSWHTTVMSEVSGDELHRKLMQQTPEGGGEFRVTDVTVTPQARPPMETVLVDAEPATARRRSAERIASSVGRLTMPSTVRVSGMQKWHGRILEIDEDIFTAELAPEDQGPTVLADFALTQLGDEDQVAVGDVVYVTVRSVAGRSGYPTQTSAVRLRRLGNWTSEEVRRIEERAEANLQSLEQFIE